MHSFIATITLFSALAAAAPHGHAHQQLHARDSEALSIAGRSDWASLPVDWLTGQCGGSTGYGCGEGYCCSQYGYCGTTSDYCGDGCQGGSCSSNASPLASNKPAPATSAAATSANLTMTSSSSAAAAQTTTTQVAPAAAASTEATSSAETTSSDPFPQATKQAGPPGGGDHTWTGAPSGAPTTFATSWAQTSAAWTPPAAPSSAPASSPAWTQPAPSSSPAATSSSAPSPSPSSGSGGSGLGDIYKYYTGTGAVSDGWPSQDQWVGDFDTMWTANAPTIEESCGGGDTPNNSPQEMSELKAAIQSVSASSGVDARFILAIVMQESHGCVRVVSTGNVGFDNPGLMQSHAGSGNCNAKDLTPAGPMQDPCPQSEIEQMIKDGTEGTDSGPGLVQDIAAADTSDVSKYYRAARIYNSGSIASSGQLQDGGATNCYSSDIANRLTGWTTGTSGCPLGHN